jgi:hypothetical protein
MVLVEQETSNTDFYTSSQFQSLEALGSRGDGGPCWIICRLPSDSAVWVTVTCIVRCSLLEFYREKEAENRDLWIFL